jgi:hypothetical protein
MKTRRRRCSPRMNHIDPMFEGDPNDILLRQISPNRRQPFPHLISLIGLLPMGSHLVLDRIDGDGLHGQFVGRSEDSDGDLSTVGDEDFFERAGVAGLFLSKGLDAAEGDGVGSMRGLFSLVRVTDARTRTRTRT